MRDTIKRVIKAKRARPAIMVTGGIVLSSTLTKSIAPAQTAATYNKTMKLYSILLHSFSLNYKNNNLVMRGQMDMKKLRLLQNSYIKLRFDVFFHFLRDRHAVQSNVKHSGVSFTITI